MAMAILNVSLSLQYIQFRLVLLKGIKMSVFVLVSKGLNGTWDLTQIGGKDVDCISRE